MFDILQNWVRDHDDRWSFVILYVGVVCMTLILLSPWVTGISVAEAAHKIITQISP